MGKMIILTVVDKIGIMWIDYAVDENGVYPL
jgi:hypothetical protein